MITVVTRSKQKKKGEKHDFGRVRHHVAYTLHTHRTNDIILNITRIFARCFFCFGLVSFFLLKRGFLFQVAAVTAVVAPNKR